MEKDVSEYKDIRRSVNYQFINYPENGTITEEGFLAWQIRKDIDLREIEGDLCNFSIARFVALAR